jgi:hypothetical protein
MVNTTLFAVLGCAQVFQRLASYICYNAQACRWLLVERYQFLVLTTLDFNISTQNHAKVTQSTCLV